MEEWIVILVCDNIPNQKFWDGKNWTTDLKQAKVYPTYAETMRAIWKDVPQESLEHEDKLARKRNPQIRIRVISMKLDIYRGVLLDG